MLTAPLSPQPPRVERERRWVTVSSDEESNIGLMITVVTLTLLENSEGSLIVTLFKSEGLLACYNHVAFHLP